MTHCVKKKAKSSNMQPVRLAGAGLFGEKSTVGWLLMTDLF
jgi:hypothetical protein